MRILIVINTNLLPNQGGVQKSTYKLHNLFKSQGYLVRVCSFSDGEGSDIRLNEECHVTYLGHKIEISRKLQRLLASFNPQICINQVGYSVSITEVLRRSGDAKMKLINTVRINPLNFVENIDGFLVKNLGKNLMRIVPINVLRKVVLIYHKNKQKRQYGHLLRLTDVLLFLSPSFIEELKFFGVDIDLFHEKLQSIPNPFIQKDCGLNQSVIKKEKTILFVGRLNIKQKRVDLLLEVWKRLHDLLPDWKFEIVGDGPEKEFMRRFCVDNSMHRVVFYGFKDPTRFYQRASILHFTSAYEGFGNVLVESQIEGTPPILCDSYSAACDIVANGRNGYLIEPFDLEDFIERTIYLSKNEDVLHEMSCNARLDSGRFRAERVLDKWVNLFETLLMS